MRRESSAHPMERAGDAGQEGAGMVVIEMLTAGYAPDRIAVYCARPSR